MRNMAFSSLATSLTMSFCNEMTGRLESCWGWVGNSTFTLLDPNGRGAAGLRGKGMGAQQVPRLFANN